MKMTVRMILAILLMGCGAFSVFGFLLSFELGRLNVFHLIYGVGGLACFSVAVWLAAGPPASQPFKTIFVTLSFLSICFVVFLCYGSLN